MALGFLLAVLSLAHLSLGGTIFTDPAQVTKNYDFIVVGGGTAGSVVATRLSENPSVSILVIEAGVADNGTDSDIIYTPLLAGTGIGTILDWNYTTTPQSGLNGRALGYPRGFVAGGSSCINSMIYSRGPSDEYNRLATVSGDFGWSWLSLLPYIFKNEKHTPPWNHRSNLGEYNPLAHGYGPLLTGLTPTVYEHDRLVIQTTVDHPLQYPFNLDLNSGNGLGFGWLQTSVGHSVRSTSASTYLRPALDSRGNIDLLLHSQVIKLVATAPNTFNAVQVAQNAAATNYQFTASKEVIVSAGAVGTPQLLMLSGIGPAQQLANVGIASAIDLPDVGNNLQDQMILTLQWEVNGTTMSSFYDDPAAYNAALAQYALNKTGIAAGNPVVNTIGFMRLPSNSPLLDGGDPAAGPNAAHYQLAFLGTFYPNEGQSSPTGGNWMSIAIVVQSPTSRGSISLTSSNAFVHPSINPAFFTTAFDIGTAIQAVKTAKAFVATSAWNDFIIAPFADTAALTTDAEIEAYIRTYSTTLKHPTSTAKISKSSDQGGVVDQHLLVKGASKLRIVDASILPSSVAGYPQAEVYIIAERAADLIKATWGLL
ncbi:aryl-alcohol oxidase-like protein [Mycena alexandri]|uniref:Aryl-alcohol oxidase-like protein n=1 Tax=Mycena alexandri TaxID=1745969 RepID=A0AAD6T5G6_9AGAR|nr:aryl-alcohol oxidase-like protein [Mycena alexandri]